MDRRGTADQHCTYCSGDGGSQCDGQEPALWRTTQRSPGVYGDDCVVGYGHLYCANIEDFPCAALQALGMHSCEPPLVPGGMAIQTETIQEVPMG